MKVLLVGGGAREHAVAYALKKNPDVVLFSVMKNRNPGIMRLSEKVSIHDEMDVEKTVEFAMKSVVEFAFVGPEAPLAAGTADKLAEVGIPCVGPKSSLARIESDKAFMRELLEKYKIPTSLKYSVFDNVEDASTYIDSLDYDYAVKPIGLTGGKGVKVMGEQLKNGAEAKEYIKEIIGGGVGGGKVIIEEKAVGEEFTLQAFVDGENISLMPSVQDHKRAFEDDTGHNTGGMGSYSDSGHVLPFTNNNDYNIAADVILKTVRALKEETGEEYKGILYGQFMVGEDIRLIEFNCRFGDPEAMNVLTVLETDLADICKGIINGDLVGKVGFKKKATVCKYVVPEGYGVESKSGEPLQIDEKNIEKLGGVIYFAAVDERDGQIYTTSSRSVGIVGVADTIEEAEKICEKSLKHVKGKHIYHRKDIGTSGLIEKKIKHMKALR